ncbi:hypothetical protein ABTY20_19105 [Streptomyces sp. NPDC126497]|uniref:hypothetical protein n=1 Tax=Streptomyces sp. NPDC126497 TaxID=3155313 RepID=UPI0033178AD7
MSGGTSCKDRAAHRPSWRVLVRKANYSAFNGGRRTPSDYSELCCRACGAVWRTRAAYVDQTPDVEPESRAPTIQNDEDRCGADPCCGQRNTPQGCIFAPKILGKVRDPRGGVSTSVARLPRYAGDPEPWIDVADTEYGGRYEESEVDAGRS